MSIIRFSEAGSCKSASGPICDVNHAHLLGSALPASEIARRCRSQPIGTSASAMTPVPNGSVPSIVALTIAGLRNARGRAMRMERSESFSRAAIVVVVASGSEESSATHCRARAMAAMRLSIRPASTPGLGLTGPLAISGPSAAPRRHHHHPNESSRSRKTI